MKCPRCGSGFVTLEEYGGITDAVCNICGSRVEISRRPTMVSQPVSGIDIPSKPYRRLLGVSPKESRRVYRNSPAGKAAWERYRYSKLYYEAHARHRKTEKYAEGQRRFKEKRKLFKLLLQPVPEFTCPLKLFHKGPDGETYNDIALCNFDGQDCQLGCINLNGG